MTASRMSNINISPMPKQYRDYHLTPKNKAAEMRSSSQRKLRFSMSRSQSISSDDGKDSEEAISYKTEYYKLQSMNQALQNDLNREMCKTEQYKNEIVSLQQRIIELSENYEGTQQITDGEKTEYLNEIKKKEQYIMELRETINSLKRQNRILTDCTLKHAAKYQQNYQNKTIAQV